VTEQQPRFGELAPASAYGPAPVPPRRRRRRSRWIVVGLAVAVAVAVVAAVAIVRQVDRDPAPGLTQRFTQPIEWRDCSDGYWCGDIDVPIDWQDPGSKSARVALIEHRPKGTPTGTILVNPGGPGESGVDLVGSDVTNAVDDAIASRYDVIGFDPPGVGYSSAVKCYGAAGTDAYLYGILPGTIGSATWIRADEKRQSRYGDACRKKTGDLLAHIDTTSAARDMDLIRADLGEKKLDYLGYSYGSYLGTVYAGLYPERVGHFVFDGADDPWVDTSSGGSGDGVVDQAVGFEGDLKAWAKACVAGDEKATGAGSCPLTGTPDQAMTQIAALLARVQKTPEKNADGRLLGSATLATAISSALYDTSEWPSLAAALRGVRAGDPATAFRLADEYNGRSPKGTYYDNSSDALTAISCLEGGGDPDLTDLRKEAAELRKKAPVLGIYQAYGDLTCDEWPVAPVAFPAPVTAEGAAPILVVGSTGDPATPYAGAKALAAQLSSGHLLTYVGEGHTIYDKGVPCIDSAVDAYLQHGTVPAAGTRCR
jgi:pimeloyl-ACP methyl ester carboxylesterase